MLLGELCANGGLNTEREQSSSGCLGPEVRFRSRTGGGEEEHPEGKEGE
jgi:hypothetical protein